MNYEIVQTLNAEETVQRSKGWLGHESSHIKSITSVIYCLTYLYLEEISTQYFLFFLRSSDWCPILLISQELKFCLLIDQFISLNTTFVKRL